MVLPAAGVHGLRAAVGAAGLPETCGLMVRFFLSACDARGMPPVAVCPRRPRPIGVSPSGP